VERSFDGTFAWTICLSVGRSVCLSAKCIVAKQLIGSGCRFVWGGEWSQSKDRSIRWVVIGEGEGAVLG